MSDTPEDSDAWARLALDVTGAGVWAWDADSGKITGDSSYRRLYGFSQSGNIDTQAWQDRVHPADRDRLYNLVLRSDNEWREEFRIIHPERGERWLEGVGRVVRDAAGTITGLAGINTDITARKHAEVALRESEARLRSIIDNAIDGIITIDSGGTVQSMNPAAVRIFGYETDEVIGQNVRMLMPEQHSKQHDGYLRHYLESGEARIIGIGREVPGRRKDGSTVALDLGITEVLQGGQRTFVGVLRDITERKRAEETQRLLLDEINHRVKNTLVTVQAMAEHSMLRAADPAHFVLSFRGRLQALSSAHNLLVEQNWAGADLKSLLRGQLLITSDDDERICLSGPNLKLDARSTVHLGLVLHELGTNARKYGALKVPAGKLSITWTTCGTGPDRVLNLTWIETGGPPVTQRQTQGFGTSLIARGLTHALSGNATLKFDPAGLICELELPLPVSNLLSEPAAGNRTTQRLFT